MGSTILLHMIRDCSSEGQSASPLYCDLSFRSSYVNVDVMPRRVFVHSDASGKPLHPSCTETRSLDQIFGLVMVDSLIISPAAISPAAGFPKDYCAAGRIVCGEIVAPYVR